MNDSLDAALHTSLAMLRKEGIGFVGPDVPFDLLLASGRPFGHLPWRIETGTGFADQWLESGFPGWSRSILEQWHAGAFDGLNAVVFSRSDDASQRLYYYIRELQRRGQLAGPAALVFDLALIPRQSSFDHSVSMVQSLASQFGIDEPALRSGVARADELRVKLNDLQQQRGADGVFFEHLTRAALWTDPTGWIDSIVLPEPRATRRVLLAGSFPPDGRLHQAVQRAGASIVAETHVHALSRLGLPLNTADANPVRQLTRQLIDHANGPRAFRDRGKWIVQQASAARAAAVILWLTREDEGLAWHVPGMRRALQSAGLPALVLPAASWHVDDGVLERIEKFCREVLP